MQEKLALSSNLPISWFKSSIFKEIEFHVCFHWSSISFASEVSANNHELQLWRSLKSRKQLLRTHSVPSRGSTSLAVRKSSFCALRNAIWSSAVGNPPDNYKLILIYCSNICSRSNSYACAFMLCLFTFLESTHEHNPVTIFAFF